MIAMRIGLMMQRGLDPDAFLKGACARVVIALLGGGVNQGK